MYRDSVIKTFKIGQSPLRICIHGQGDIRWPTEIHASIYFAPNATNTSKKNKTSKDKSPTPVGYLPVRAYFQTALSPSSIPEWHLDIKCRPAFHRLLETLDIMHRDGYCHDDIKSANILVQSKTHRLVGDLGNLCHVAHPYHNSRIWRENHQLPDCRANDAVRAMKTYLYFLHKAAWDADTFDAEFFDRKEPLSLLYWKVMSEAQNMSARRLQSLSLSEAPLSTSRFEANSFRLTKKG